MGTSNLKISNECMQCGSCLGCGFPFLKSADDGKIVVLSGTYVDPNGAEIEMLREVCPVNAFSISNSESKQELLSNLIEELKNYPDLINPTREQFGFVGSEYSIPTPCASGEYKFDYTSSDAAERAALKEFERAMYSQIDDLILRVITAYRVKKVKPYYSELLEDGSVYATNNKKITEILQGIKNILGDKLPEDFTDVNAMPSRDETWKMLNKGQIISDELISDVKYEFDYPSSQYDCYWMWDDMEVNVGTDWRGKPKYGDRYCYNSLDKAFANLAKDLLTACGRARDDFEEAAVRHSSHLVKVYNEELKKEIQQKLQLAESSK